VRTKPRIFALFVVLALLSASLFVGVSNPVTAFGYALPFQGYFFEGVETASHSREASAAAGVVTLLATAALALRTIGFRRFEVAKGSVLLLSSLPMFFLHARAATGVAFGEAAFSVALLATFLVRNRYARAGLAVFGGGLVYQATHSYALALVPAAALASCTQTRLRILVLLLWLSALGREALGQTERRELTPFVFRTSCSRLLAASRSIQGSRATRVSGRRSWERWCSGQCLSGCC
jgi:hypothetical protein